MGVLTRALPLRARGRRRFGRDGGLVGDAEVAGAFGVTGGTGLRRTSSTTETGCKFFVDVAPRA
jgi:hypothetical protein